MISQKTLPTLARSILPIIKNFGVRPLSTAHHHQLNISKAVLKSHEGDSFRSLSDAPVSVLQGIGPKHQNELAAVGIQTVHDLATYKFFHLARAITTLAATEESNGRLNEAVMNLDQGLDKAYEHLPLHDIMHAPTSALQGITEETGLVFQQLGCKTIADLAKFKYCQWAEAIVTAARFEKN